MAGDHDRDRVRAERFAGRAHRPDVAGRGRHLAVAAVSAVGIRAVRSSTFAEQPCVSDQSSGSRRALGPRSTRRASRRTSSSRRGDSSTRGDSWIGQLLQHVVVSSRSKPTRTSPRSVAATAAARPASRFRRRRRQPDPPPRAARCLFLDHPCAHPFRIVASPARTFWRAAARCIPGPRRSRRSRDRPQTAGTPLSLLVRQPPDGPPQRRLAQAPALPQPREAAPPGSGSGPGRGGHRAPSGPIWNIQARRLEVSAASGRPEAPKGTSPWNASSASTGPTEAARNLNSSPEWRSISRERAVASRR